MNVGKKAVAVVTLALTLNAGAVLALSMSLAAWGKVDRPAPSRELEYGDAFVDSMIRLLHEGDDRTRFGAAHALAEFKGPAVKKAECALVCALDDKHPLVAKEALRALKKLNPAYGELAFQGPKSGSMP